MENKTVLLTGATGFLGRHILEELTKRNIPVRVFRRRLIDVDETDFEGVSSVIHCAALTPGKNSTASEYYEVNARQTAFFLKECQRREVQKFIYISTMGLKFLNPYTSSKLAAEESVLSSSLNIVVLRVAHLYGPNEHMRGFLHYLSRKRILHVVGGTGGDLSIVYVRDCARVVVNALEQNPLGNLYNVVQCGISRRTYLQTLLDRIGGKCLIIQLPQGLVKTLFGEEYLRKQITNLRLPGIDDWSFEPTPLHVGVVETCSVLGI